MRWLRLLLLFCALLSSGVNATIYSSPQLNDANKLVEISPIQAKKIASNYLVQRQLSDQSDKSLTALSREEADNRLRSPRASIDAYKVLAKAEFNLGNTRQALEQLDLASTLTQTHRLPYQKMDVDILRTRLVWLTDHDSTKAKLSLDNIDHNLQLLDNSQQLTRGITYRLTMLRAKIASKESEISAAENFYAEAKNFINTSNSEKNLIEYHLQIGEFYLNHKQYNRALSELLFGYWKSVESDLSPQLAQVNRLLAQLFLERQVLDKAIEHLSQAADFYNKYDQSPILSHVLKMMGDIYFQQGKYNLALVHFFNVLDHESTAQNIEQVIEVRISLAATYLNLYNYPLAEQYLNRAIELLEYTDISALRAKAELLRSGLAYHQHESKNGIIHAHKALAIAKNIKNKDLMQRSYDLLSMGYEQNEQYALALDYMKKYNMLVAIKQQQLNQISEDAFRQQKEFAEQTLHYANQENELKQMAIEHRKYQKIAFSLFALSIILFFVVMRRGFIIQALNRQNSKLTKQLYTHSRSKLRNLRMLNAKLSSSLQKTSDTFEQWQMGELIHEPLNDRLRFVMIDLPFLRSMYIQHGYKSGLELEESFGQYLASKVEGSSRLYHFSDANLLYIESNSDRNASPEAMFSKIQTWINEFEPNRKINRRIRIGIADYPFLPRAYTAINDQELLDVLLMSTHLARDISLKEHSSEWVYFKAIDNAPAASLATGNIREACKHAINQGLIKIQSSYQNEDNIKKMLKDE
ncbi:tetratricopeptide repeat protein [Vibrio genomosp. F6]|uniref:Tetratricopeptide repeat protein n=1 Tax=Vibrio genomosp. F6 str. FF-238 TaxID=1191298 RepID=A0A1E5D5R9_9VIBR|nr:hypothetical protein [Vibrio genomosp. F6]OEE78953.1 hypothetical protein A130_12220 [Vibrio genomosp. F6 str. FF-238]